MAPAGSGPSEPSGDLGAQIAKDFGSFDAFKAHFTAAAGAVEGSGWALLVWEPNAGQLEVLTLRSTRT